MDVKLLEMKSLFQFFFKLQVEILMYKQIGYECRLFWWVSPPFWIFITSFGCRYANSKWRRAGNLKVKIGDIHILFRLKLIQLFPAIQRQFCSRVEVLLFRTSFQPRSATEKCAGGIVWRWPKNSKKKSAFTRWGNVLLSSNTSRKAFTLWTNLEQTFWESLPRLSSFQPLQSSSQCSFCGDEKCITFLWCC